jgi:tetratricopeptide (TPR) repeat protein
MRKISYLLGALAVLFLLASLGFSQTADEHIQKGDEYYAQFDDQKALDEYLAAVNIDQANYQALWKLSRAHIDVADLVEGKGSAVDEKKKKMYSDAESYAKKAIAANPNDTWGHFYLSAAMGKRLLLLGKKEQIAMSKAVRAEIDKAIELDAANDLAYHALGRWHRRMAEIGGAKRFFGSIIYGSIPKGSFEESETNLKKAVELKPDYINHHLELGITYMSLDKYDLAAQEFQKCIDLPETSSKDKMLKNQAKDELAKANKKK